MQDYLPVGRLIKRAFILMGLALLLLPAGCGSGSNDLRFSTEYQAIFLDNGQVFFGRLEDAGPQYITLRDVYYVQRLVDQDKKESKNILVKRGNEWHSPEAMRLNVQHVLVIEPVGPESRVAQLIREAKSPPASSMAPPPAETPKPSAQPEAPKK